MKQQYSIAVFFEDGTKNTMVIWGDSPQYLLRHAMDFNTYPIVDQPNPISSVIMVPVTEAAPVVAPTSVKPTDPGTKIEVQVTPPAPKPVESDPELNGDDHKVVTVDFPDTEIEEEETPLPAQKAKPTPPPAPKPTSPAKPEEMSVTPKEEQVLKGYLRTKSGRANKPMDWRKVAKYSEIAEASTRGIYTNLKRKGIINYEPTEESTDKHMSLTPAGIEFCIAQGYILE